MWFLAVSLPLLPAIIAMVLHYRAEISAMTQHLLLRVLSLHRCKVCVRDVHAFVFINCTHGNHQSVLEAFDQYARSHPSHSIDPLKGEFLEGIVQRVTPMRVLELGTHCGYTAIRILRALPPGAYLITVENNPETAEAGEELILVAGFKHHQFKMLTCTSSEAILRLPSLLDHKQLEVVVMNHGAAQCLQDLITLEQMGLLAPGCLVLVNCADPPFLKHVQEKPGQYRIHSRTHNMLQLQRLSPTVTLNKDLTQR